MTRPLSRALIALACLLALIALGCSAQRAHRTVTAPGVTVSEDAATAELIGEWTTVIDESYTSGTLTHRTLSDARGKAAPTNIITSVVTTILSILGAVSLVP